MGAVLEMKRIYVGLAVALTLAGCAEQTGETAGLPGSTGAESRIPGIVSQVGRVIGGIRSDESVSAARTIPGGFSPQAIAAEPGAYRLVQIYALGVQEPARVIQQNGDEITIALQSGPTAAFDGGILVATRGFGEDPIAIESRGVAEALRSGGGTVTRRIETLDAQDQIRTQSFSCAINAAGTESVNLGLRELPLRRFDESCRSESLGFDNIYWLDAAGNILASRQYVSPSVAYLRASVL